MVPRQVETNKAKQDEWVSRWSECSVVGWRENALNHLRLCYTTLRNNISTAFHLLMSWSILSSSSCDQKQLDRNVALLLLLPISIPEFDTDRAVTKPTTRDIGRGAGGLLFPSMLFLGSFSPWTLAFLVRLFSSSPTSSSGGAQAHKEEHSVPI